MLEINIGKPFPLGSSVTKNGVNFSIVATNAKYIEILIFDNNESIVPKFIYKLDRTFKSGDYWHAEIIGLKEGAIYAYKIFQKENGINKDYSQKVLIDPCSRGIVGWDKYKREQAISSSDNSHYSLKSVVCEREQFNFSKFPRPKHCWSETIIYELQVKAFAEGINNNNNDSCFKKIKEKIPYLKDLGITSIELLPIFCFDPTDAPKGLENFWGYSPINWFTPHFQYFSDTSPKSIREEFRNFVEECHKNNIEVILDVVYNHTSEGNIDGPTISWKGIDENLYYFIDSDNNYQDISGCGNTIAANRGLVRRLIIESLKCWANELGVDGFRFDLGIALSRGENLVPLENPPFFEDIESDPELTELKLISEPWDCGGLYKIKNFPSKNTFTWNGHYRDDIRRFWKGDENTAWNMSDKISGSPSIYENHSKSTMSINFVTSHDGYTLKDLVTFNKKYNFANREQNKDGENNNNSSNYGVEGPCLNENINKLRKRQQKNMLFSLLISRGVPMILMGDEVGRSQGGNNNTWCQNNLLGWMSWDEDNQDQELREYVKSLITLRKSFSKFLNPNSNEDCSYTKYNWHGTDLNKPDWGSWSHTLAFSINSINNHPLIWVGLNAYSKNIKFSIPKSRSKWKKIIDTSEDNSFNNKLIKNKFIEITNRSSVLIVANELLESNNQVI